MQKLITCLSFMLCIVAATWAQTNHVPNGNFEDYTSCPTAISQFSRATGWSSLGGSPDFFLNNGICTWGVPGNQFGSEFPADGFGYGGFHTQGPNAGSREYMTRQITPLQIGRRYEVSMSVSLGDNSAYATTGLGIHFYDNGPPALSSAILSFTPSVDYSGYGPLSADTGWTRFVGYFTADSAYDNIIIGIFKPSTSLTITPWTGTSYNYHYIDSIVIKAANIIHFTVPDTVACQGDTLQIPYTRTEPNFFTTGNTFTLQLSNSSGSFASPVNIGSVTSTTDGTINAIIPDNTSPGTGYKLRIVASSPADTSRHVSKSIKVHPKPVLSASSNSAICENATLNLSVVSSITGSGFSWSGPTSFASSGQNPARPSMMLADAGAYIVTGITSEGCIARDTEIVIVNPIPLAPVAGNNSPICEGDQLLLTASSSTGGVSYSWSGPSFSSVTQNPAINNAVPVMSGIYTVTANRSGCVSPPATTSVTVKPTPVAQATAHVPVCVGGTIQLAGNSLGGATYQWTGPSFTSLSQSPSFAAASPSQSGNYILTITANGCLSEPDTVYVKVNVLSRIGGYASPDDTICRGALPTFVAFVQDGGPAPVAQWYQNNIPVGNLNSLIFTPSTVNTGDLYYCKLTAPDVCFTTLVLYTDTIKMVVLPIVTMPEVNITAVPGLNVRPSDLVKFTANLKYGGANPRYQWYRNGVAQTGATSATYDVTGLSYMDMIHVDVVSDDPCAQNKNASDTVWVQFPANVGETASPYVKLYPNPNSGVFTVSGIDESIPAIEIINALGQTVHRQKNKRSGDKTLIEAQLPVGVYHLRAGALVLRFSVQE